MPVYIKETLLAADVDTVWAFHAGPDALQRLTPPDSGVKVVRFEPVAEGKTVELRIRLWPLPFRARWVARYQQVEPPRHFADVAQHSPFKRWEHHHHFIAEGHHTRMRDQVQWEAPLPPLGNMLSGPVVHRMLRLQFEYRHQVLVDLFGAA